MPGNKDGAKKARQTQLLKLGSAEALSAEMSRRAKMRKSVGGGFRNNPELARRAREARKTHEERVKRPRTKEAAQTNNDTAQGSSEETTQAENQNNTSAQKRPR